MMSDPSFSYAAPNARPTDKCSLALLEEILQIHESSFP
jgi:hypothetical protein